MRVRSTGGAERVRVGAQRCHICSGAYSSFEYLRRQTFNGWTLDKAGRIHLRNGLREGLMRGFLWYCLKPSYGPDLSPSSDGLA